MFFQLYFACCSAFFSSVALLALSVSLFQRRALKRALKNSASIGGQSK